MRAAKGSTNGGERDALPRFASRHGIREADGNDSLIPRRRASSLRYAGRMWTRSRRAGNAGFHRQRTLRANDGRCGQWRHRCREGIELSRYGQVGSVQRRKAPRASGLRCQKKGRDSQSIGIQRSSAGLHPGALTAGGVHVSGRCFAAPRCSPTRYRARCPVRRVKFVGSTAVVHPLRKPCGGVHHR